MTTHQQYYQNLIERVQLLIEDVGDLDVLSLLMDTRQRLELLRDGKITELLPSDD